MKLFTAQVADFCLIRRFLEKYKILGDFPLQMPRINAEVPRIRLQSHQIYLHRITIIQHYAVRKDDTKKHKHKQKESRHSEMGPVRLNPILRTVRTAHLSVLMTVHNFSTQYSTEQF